MDATAARLQDFLLYVLLPLWLLVGFADWACHRAQRIEATSGEHESRLHLLMLGELGLGVAAALLLEITTAVAGLLVVLAVAHELTVWRDLAWTAGKRHIPIVEQWVHGLQQAIPWAALVAVLLLNPQAASGLVGLADPDWSLRLKADPLPLPWLLAFAAGGALLVLLPFVEEYRRCAGRRNP